MRVDIDLGFGQYSREMFLSAAAAAVIRHLTLSSRTMMYKIKKYVSYTTCGVSYNPTMAL